MNYITLNNGVKIPQIGLGVFRTPDGADTANAVKWAIEAGYRHIDTAKVYGNEKSVGEGRRMSGIDRRDIFVTTSPQAITILNSVVFSIKTETLTNTIREILSQLFLRSSGTDVRRY